MNENLRSFDSMIKELMQQQHTLLQDISRFNTSKIFQNISSFSTKSYLDTTKPFTSLLDANKLIALHLKKQLDSPVSYYSKNELRAVKTPTNLPHKSKGIRLISQLSGCKSGVKEWSEYQDICKEILCYCLVPPLLEPLEQSTTNDGLHVRDMIFHIPYELSRFWTFIIEKFGLALIIECKNYQQELKENELRITSKYLGKKKLTKLGVIVTRKGLHANAIRAQENIWKDEDKMILCMNDEQLKKMIELKENEEEPWKVIDSLIRDFLSSLS